MDKLHQLSKHESDQAGRVLSEAFRDDPVFNAIFLDAPPEQRVAFFSAPVIYSMKYGQVFAPSGQLEGIAAWVPGAYADMNLFRMISSGAFWTGMKMGMEIAKKLKVIFGPVEHDRKEHMLGRSYIYLQIIGISPQYQGQGLGGKLLHALFAESEKSGLPIYLETETDENVSLYEHLGFSVLRKVTLPLIDLPMWEMIREPEPA